MPNTTTTSAAGTTFDHARSTTMISTELAPTASAQPLARPSPRPSKNCRTWVSNDSLLTENPASLAA